MGPYHPEKRVHRFLPAQPSYEAASADIYVDKAHVRAAPEKVEVVDTHYPGAEGVHNLTIQDVTGEMDLVRPPGRGRFLKRPLFAQCDAPLVERTHCFPRNGAGLLTADARADDKRLHKRIHFATPCK